LPQPDGQSVGALKAGTRFFGTRMQFGKSFWVRVEEGTGARPPLYSPSVSYMPPRSPPAVSRSASHVSLKSAPALSRASSYVPPKSAPARSQTGLRSESSARSSTVGAHARSKERSCRLYEQSMVEHVRSIYGADPSEAEAVWIKDTGQHLIRLRDAHHFTALDPKRRQRYKSEAILYGDQHAHSEPRGEASQLSGLRPSDFPQPAASGLLSHSTSADSGSWAKFCHGASMNMRLFHVYGAPASTNCGRWRQLPD